MELLKDLYYGPNFYKGLAEQIKTVFPELNKQIFYKQAIAGLDELELKQRVTRTAQICRQHLPANYKKSLRVLYRYSECLTDDSFSNIFIPEFVATYGQDCYALSMQALKDFTRHSSSEFAIRIFLTNDLKRTLKIMCDWSRDESYHVRRLASEGTRPRLPWATRVPGLIENPGHAAPILKALKADKEKYVQKSVANHLNDISKAHPEWMLELVEKWGHRNTDTAWIIKHASRGLIKSGHPRALSLFGVSCKVSVKLNKFKLAAKEISLGEKLIFSFIIKSTASSSQKLIVDYKLYFMKNDGKRKPKVFKIREINLAAGEFVEINKKHLFKDFTTRKHYAGKHELEIVINGNGLSKKQFELFI